MPVHNVEFVILGSGTSAGVPVIGCDCAVCTSADPRDRRTRPSACVRFRDPTGHDRVILIDTSPDLREQALRLRLRRCDAIVYTHGHVDHTFGLDEVRRFNALMKAPIDVYAEGVTLEHLGRAFRHIFSAQENINESFVATLIPHEVAPGGALDLFGLRISPLRLLHGRMPILGYRLEALGDDGAPAAAQPGPFPIGYCTDVSGIPPQTWSGLEGLGVLVLDMLRYRRHPTHFSVDEALDAARRVGARRTWFTHMAHDISHADLDPKLPEGMALGYDGLVIR